MSAPNPLQVGGPCAGAAFELGFEDCAALPTAHQVPDLSALVPGRRGSALRFAALIERARPTAATRFVHVASEDGGFTASLPLEDLRERGFVLYGLGGAPLPADLGGPFRLLIADSEDCSVNVKFLARVEFADGQGSHTARCADGG